MRRREREKGVEREKTRKSVRPSVRPRDGCWVWRAGVCGVCMYIHTYVCICVCVCVYVYPGAGEGRGGEGGIKRGHSDRQKRGKSGEKVGKEGTRFASSHEGRKGQGDEGRGGERGRGEKTNLSSFSSTERASSSSRC